MEWAGKVEYGHKKNSVRPVATLVVEVETGEGTYLLETLSMQKK